MWAGNMLAVMMIPVVRALLKVRALNNHPSTVISIDCEAVKCVYNSNYKCTASHVDIKGCGACDCGETACSTFKEK